MPQQANKHVEEQRRSQSHAPNSNPTKMTVIAKKLKSVFQQFTQQCAQHHQLQQHQVNQLKHLNQERKPQEKILPVDILTFEIIPNFN